MNNSKPQIEEKKFVCPHCGADWADSTMIGDPEYNDMWKCDICNEEYGTAKMVSHTPTYKGEEKLDYKQMVIDIDSLVQTDFAFDMNCRLVDKEPKFKDEESKEMAKLIGKIYTISHKSHCTACQSNYIITPTPQLNWEEEFQKAFNLKHGSGHHALANDGKKAPTVKSVRKKEK